MPQVTKTQYLAELNARLQAHPDDVPGMQFLAAPDAAQPEAASGYTWTPNAEHHPFVFIAHSVAAEFTV